MAPRATAPNTHQSVTYKEKKSNFQLCPQICNRYNEKKKLIKFCRKMENVNKKIKNNLKVKKKN